MYTLQKLASALNCRLVVGLLPLTAPGQRLSKEAPMSRLRRLFWDKPLASANIRNHPLWVVRRVLEYGGLSDVHALVRLLGKGKLLQIAASLRFSSKRTARFWEAMLAQEGVKCRKKSSPRAAGISWQQ